MTFHPKAFSSVNRAEDSGAIPTGAIPISSAAASGKLYGMALAERTAHLDRFDQLDVLAHPEECIYWGFMRPYSRPCFTRELLHELRMLQDSVRAEYARRQREHGTRLQYFVFGSHTPSVFNLGGDLALFANCIRNGDRESLSSYAQLCVDAVYQQAISLELPIITIALVQGDALGGGFESALACNLIVAERSAKFGLPEILFNLFPGMGAYNFLARRLDAARAEKIILSGRIFSAAEMHDMGIVDVLAEDGYGEDAVREYVARNARRFAAERAIYAARQLVQPVRLGELRALAEIWVDAALDLAEADLRRIERLAAAQDRRMAQRQATMLAAE
jgi:DSF synthase